MSGALHPAIGRTAPLARLAAVGLALALLTATGPVLHRAYGGAALLLIFAAGGAAIWLALRTVEGADPRRALIVILGVAALIRLALLLPEPYLSTDIYRYIWDGRVQAAGINPYRYLPSAPELAHLRDAVIFPRINRADTAVTIYPPTAQLVFLALTRLGESVVAMKLGLLAFEAATVAALMGLLHRVGRPVTHVVAYAWHPLPVLEIAGSGHVDAAMCTLLMAGLLLFLHGRTRLASAVVALGALVKPTALLALPVLWRPWDWRLPLVVLLTVAGAYLPYLSVGSGVLGYLWGYVDEEGLVSGRGFSVLWLLERLAGPVPGAVRIYVAVAAMIMLAIALAVAFRRDRSAEAAIAGLGWLLTVFLILASPHFPWYFVVLVPWLALRPTAAAWVLTLASPLLYDNPAGALWPGYDVRIAAFTLATAGALTFDVWRLRRTPITLTVGETHGRHGRQPAPIP